MGGCIKALLTGSQREELESLPLHTSSKCQSTCKQVSASKTTNASKSKQDHVSTVAYSPYKKRQNFNLADINSANYHQLCVLAKISTDEAKAIINYRVFVCGGKISSIEQLLDIPEGGITPEKLHHIRNSMTVGPGHATKATAITESQRSKSCKQLNREQKLEYGTAPLDFINSANCHQLCVLARISIGQAETILKYKVHECGGRFSSIGQLLDIHGSGITPEKMEFIVKSSKACPAIQAHHSPNRNRTRHKVALKSHDQAEFTLSIGDLNFGDLNFDDDTPKCKLASGSKENLIRIGSWNLECFTTSKVSNLGVLEVVCMTILMNGLDIIAFQELGDEGAIKKVCEELNHPTLKKVQSWPSRKDKWCIVSEKTGRMYQGVEYSAFLWNKSTGIHLRSCGLLGKQKGASDDLFFVRKPFIGAFNAADWTFVLISLHLKSAGWSGEHTERVTNEIKLLAPLVQATNEVVNGKQDVILLGDFNMTPDNGSFGSLSGMSYVPIFPASEPTNISFVNLKGNRSYDNIWITTQLHSERYTGQYKIVRRGLLHELIEGKKQGTRGTVSDHCPIWASFSNRTNNSK